MPSRPGWREALARPALEVAPLLLGLVLVHGETSGRIVEVEAYGDDDAASHAYRGPTPRNMTMFGPPGHLYVYLVYGMHHCANVVCGPPSRGEAVLVRALAPLAGLETMRSRRRSAATDEALCAGPGRLCASLGIDRGLDGADLLDPSSPVRIFEDGGSSAAEILVGKRIGLSRRAGQAVDLPWRFGLAGSPCVSRRFATPRDRLQ
jgi:DNA-3-methyladenine glycosylase